MKDLWDSLTDKERVVTYLILQGMSYTAIARKLSNTRQVINNLVHTRILLKTGMDNRIALVGFIYGHQELFECVETWAKMQASPSLRCAYLRNRNISITES